MPDWSPDFSVALAVIVTSHLALAILRRHLSPLRLTPEQHAILAFIATKGSCLRSELLAALHISRENSESQFVDYQMQAIALSDRGLLERTPAEDDIVLTLPPLGRSVLEASRPLLANAQAELASKFPPGRASFGLPVFAEAR